MKYEIQFSKSELASIFTETDGQKKYLHGVMEQKIMDISVNQSKVKVHKGTLGAKLSKQKQVKDVICYAEGLPA